MKFVMKDLLKQYATQIVEDMIEVSISVLEMKHLPQSVIDAATAYRIA